MLFLLKTNKSPVFAFFLHIVDFLSLTRVNIRVTMSFGIKLLLDLHFLHHNTVA